MGFLAEIKLPQAIDIERALLGCIIKEPERLLDCLSLKSEDFYLAEHQKVWEIIQQLDNQGITPDLPLVGQKAVERGLNVAYVAGLPFAEYAFPSQVSAYVTELKDKSRRRKMINACRQAAMALTDSSDPDTVEAKLIQEITAVDDTGDVQKIADVGEEVITEILSRDDEKIRGISFGIYELDADTGGMQPADLIILAGRPGMGKSAAGLKIGYEASKLNYNVLYMTLEMPPKDLYLRLLTMKTGISLKMLRNGNKFYDREKEALRKASAEIKELSLNFVFKPGITSEAMRRITRSEKMRGNCDLLIVDHAGRMKSGTRSESDYAEVSKVVESLKNLGIELKIPVLALYQLHRGLENRQDKRPTLSDLRGSGRIEEEADIVLFLYREKYYKRDADNTLEINIAKQRNGEMGDTARHEIPFDSLWRENSLLDKLEEVSDEEVPF